LNIPGGGTEAIEAALTDSNNIGMGCSGFQLIKLLLIVIEVPWMQAHGAWGLLTRHEKILVDIADGQYRRRGSDMVRMNIVIPVHGRWQRYGVLQMGGKWRNKEITGYKKRPLGLGAVCIENLKPN
jgi:hypothetical protein